MLLLIAVSGLQPIVVQNRVTTQVNQLVAAINFARSEAIKRGQPVIFCQSNDGKTCSGQWRDGQVVLAGNEVLRVYPALPGTDQLTWSSNLGKDNALTMLPSGFTNGQNGSFNYCPANHHYAKRIIVNQSGRMLITTEQIAC